MKTLKFEQKQNGSSSAAIGVLTLSRPEALNALNSQMLLELDSLLDRLILEKQLKVLIITGEGPKAFAAGADIKEMESMNPDEALAFARRGQRVFSNLSEAPFVSLAAVNGFALGGGFELALACNIMLASESARFGLPEVSLGLIPGYGGTQRSVRQLGPSLANFMVLSGEMITASEAEKFGLVAKVTKPDELMALAVKTAEGISRKSPHAIAVSKKVMQQGAALPLREGLELEAQGFREAFAHPDSREGIKAFVEKRLAKFQNL